MFLSMSLYLIFSSTCCFYVPFHVPLFNLLLNLLLHFPFHVPLFNLPQPAASMFLSMSLYLIFSSTCCFYVPFHVPLFNLLLNLLLHFPFHVPSFNLPQPAASMLLSMSLYLIFSSTCCFYVPFHVPSFNLLLNLLLHFPFHVPLFNLPQPDASMFLSMSPYLIFLNLLLPCSFI